MNWRRWTLLAVLGLVGLGGVRAETADELFAAAERSFNEKTWDRAIEGYDRFFVAAPNDPRNVEAQYKQFFAKARLRKDDIDAPLTAFGQAYRTTIWGARGRLLLANWLFERNRWGNWERIGKLYEQALSDRAAVLGGRTPSREERKEEIDWRFAAVNFYSQWWRDNNRELSIGHLNAVIAAGLDDETVAQAWFRLAAVYRTNGEDVKKMLAALELIVKEFAGTSVADNALYQLAEYDASQGDYVRARARYLDLRARYPRSELEKQALDQIRTIEAPAMHLQLARTHLPGAKVPYHLTARNVKGVTFTAYSVDPFETKEFSGNYLSDFETLRKTGRVETTWHKDVPDQGKYEYHEFRLEVPVGTPGLYVIAAVADGQAKVQQSTLLNISSLVMVQQFAGDKLISYVADRLTRQPVSAVDLRVMRPYNERNGQRLRDTATGQTDGDGLWQTKLPPRPNNGDWQLWTIGRHKDQILLQDNGLWTWWNDPGVAFKGYIYTDRSVYRPDNTVHYKALLRLDKEGNFVNLENKRVEVVIHDPRGKELLKTTLTTDEFGSLGGDLKLEKEPTLGAYSLQLHYNGQSAGGTFRVEEYRKPEFKVEVGKPLTQVRAGSVASIPVTAKYYFGSPVADADIKYVVKRRNYYTFHWWGRGEWDWFYAGWERPSRRWYGGDQVVLEGTSKTDSQGKFTVDFATLKDGNDYTYSVDVEVADVARRTVEGSGSVTVTQRAFFLYANPSQQLYKPGDKVALNVKAEDADKHPVTTDVYVDLWSMKWVPDVRDKDTRRITVAGHYERDKRVSTQRATTDPDTGERKVLLDAPADGHWELGLRAQDPWDKQGTITATANFWTASDAWKGRNHDYANLQLVTARDVYKKGEKARILVNSPEPAGALFLTMGATHLYDAKVLRYEGNSFVVELPVLENYAPNVYINAAVVGVKQVYFSQLELKVPPTDKFLKVSVQSDQAEYKPGTKGTFTLLTTDQADKPVSAQVSLGITDDSVYAIAEDQAPNIGLFFHGNRRWNQVRTAVSFEGYGEYDEEFAAQRKDGKPGERLRAGVAGGGAGGGFGRRALGENAAMAMPMAAAPPMAAKAERAMDAADKGMDRDGVEKQAAADEQAGANEPIKVRSYFPDTIIWQPSVVTGADGKATVNVDFPDSLTTWRATARAVTKATDVGQQVARVVTTKDLICRLQAPRFFTQLDESTVSLIVTNKTSRNLEVALNLAVEGLELVGGGTGKVAVEPYGQSRVDKLVRATGAGNASLTLTARGAKDSDGVKQDYVVVPHGAEKFAAASGQVKGGVAHALLNLPAQRRAGTTKLKVALQPTIMNSLVDALPYLVQYPYGCVEQTTSKFLPCVRVANTLKYTGAVSPGSGKPAQAPAWWEGRGLAALPEMVKAGVDRLSSMQNGDGGFGWFGGMRSDPWMSAYALYGLNEAAKAGFNVNPEILKRAGNFLYENLHLAKSQLDNSAYISWVLTECKSVVPNAGQAKYLDETLARVYDQRDDLNDYTRSLLIMAEVNRGDRDKAGVLWRNLQARRIETDNGCHWGQNRWGWRWSDDQVETTAFALLAAEAVEPESPLAAKAASWLVLNRTGNQWYSTKDTSAAVLAISKYASDHNELAQSYSATISVNGHDLKGYEINPANALSLNAEVTVDPALLVTGNNDIAVKTAGGGAPYFSAMLEYYSQEDLIGAASNMLSADRKYYRLSEYTDEDRHRQVKRELLENGQPIASGEQIEVEVNIKAENDFSYVAFRDPKPAGCEPVDQTSGGTWGGTWAYRELRDREVTFFVDHLSQGETKLSYKLRAETPGTFRALPHHGFAMYRPDVRCLSDEAIIKVGERVAAK